MKTPCRGNLFDALPAPQDEESFFTLFDSRGVRIERIVSHHHASPPGFWYEQANDEWVLLLRGAATLEFSDGRTQTLDIGDWITLPAGFRHRVADTAAHTVWLAVHMAK